MAQRDENALGQQARHDADHKRGADEFQQMRVAALPVGGPDQPQPDDHEHRDDVPHLGEAGQHAGEYAAPALGRAQMGRDHAPVAQNEYDEQHMVDQQHEFLQRDLRGRVEAQQQRDVQDRHAEHGDALQPADPANHRGRRVVVHPYQPQRRNAGREQRAGDAQHGAEDGEGIDDAEHQHRRGTGGGQRRREQVGHGDEGRDRHDVQQECQQRQRQQPRRTPQVVTDRLLGGRLLDRRVVARRQLAQPDPTGAQNPAQREPRQRGGRHHH